MAAASAAPVAALPAHPVVLHAHLRAPVSLAANCPHRGSTHSRFDCETVPPVARTAASPAPPVAPPRPVAVAPEPCRPQRPAVQYSAPLRPVQSLSSLVPS